MSHLMDCLDSESEKREIIERIRRKFSQLPNTGHIEIWLQRISHPLDSDSDLDFDEPLCKVVSQGNAEIWNVDWISSDALREAIDPRKVVDCKILAEIPRIIPIEEVELFESGYSYS